MLQLMQAVGGGGRRGGQATADLISFSRCCLVGINKDASVGLAGGSQFV